MRLLIKNILSNGCVLGNVKKMNTTGEYVKANSSKELKRFYEARDITIKQIQELKKENKDMIDYLTIQELMVLDPNLEIEVKAFISEKMSAVDAVKKSMEKYKAGLSNSSSTYLQERILDIDDVTHRIANNLTSIYNSKEIHPYILSADNIYPSYLIANKDNILGIIVKNGGYTSHAAIMCRGWDIPLVVVDADFDEDETVVIDTGKGIVIRELDDAELNDYSNKVANRLSYDKRAVLHGDYLFLANVSSNEDLKRVLDYGFDGVGLYRTEMIFMNTDRPYTLEEQYQIYSDAVECMKDKSICFRTFDIGDDKKLSYLNASKKGIDNYKNNPMLFTQQVKAMLMANKYNNMRIMYPMIESNEEFIYLKNWVSRIALEDNLNIPKIGMMLETKEALNNIESFKLVDFISIGTNDLTSELYKLDRDNAIERLDEYKSDLVDRLKIVVNFCHKNNISLSICGELASVPSIANLFYRIGIKNLSVSPSSIRTLNSIYTDFINE